MAIAKKIHQLCYVILMLALPVVTTASPSERGQQQFIGGFMDTLTVLVANATNENSDGEKKISAACTFARILAGLTPSETNMISDKLIDDITGLLSNENDTVKTCAATGLGWIGPRARRAIPALERALKRAQPAAGSEVIGPSLSPAGAFNLAITRILLEK